MSFVVDELSPFTNYNCSVSANTSVGEGPYSDPMTAQTDQDSKRAYASVLYTYTVAIVVHGVARVVA